MLWVIRESKNNFCSYKDNIRLLWGSNLILSQSWDSSNWCSTIWSTKYPSSVVLCMSWSKRVPTKNGLWWSS